MPRSLHDYTQVSRSSDGDHSQVVRTYSRIFRRGNLAQLDGRSVEGRLVRRLEAELVAHIGGNPTIAQRLLIQRICTMRLQLDAFGEKLETEEWTAHDTRTYSGLSNAYNRALRELDRMKPNKTRTPSLEEVIGRHRNAS